MSCVSITEHAKERFKERTSVKKSVSEKNAEKAFENGIDRTEISGGLRRYLDRKYYAKECYRTLKIYCGYVYIFGANGSLITMFEIPVEFKKRASDIYNKKKQKRLNESCGTSLEEE